VCFFAVTLLHLRRYSEKEVYYGCIPPHLLDMNLELIKEAISNSAELV
jgi:hypothetical protein